MRTADGGARAAAPPRARGADGGSVSTHFLNAPFSLPDSPCGLGPGGGRGRGRAGRARSAGPRWRERVSVQGVRRLGCDRVSRGSARASARFDLCGPASASGWAIDTRNRPGKPRAPEAGGLSAGGKEAETRHYGGDQGAGREAGARRGPWGPDSVSPLKLGKPNGQNRPHALPEPRGAGGEAGAAGIFLAGTRRLSLPRSRGYARKLERVWRPGCGDLRDGGARQRLGFGGSAGAATSLPGGWAEWAGEGSQRRRASGGLGWCARGPPPAGGVGWKGWAAGEGGGEGGVWGGAARGDPIG